MTGQRRTIGAVAFAVAATIFLRLAFWGQTGETLEDSLITLRYAENIAEGRGFVYNAGEHVLGTTTPLWTLVLAATGAAGIPDVQSAAKIIGIVCDAGTLLLLLLLLNGRKNASPVFFALLFATSPWIVRMSVSGMETPLLLLSMSIALFGLERRTSAFGAGLAMTMLTRIDGAVFAGVMVLWALSRDWRWTIRQAGLTLLLCLPWILFAWASFGSVVPQSFAAKRAVYHFGVSTSSAPFLNAYTPLGETNPLRFAAKCFWGLSVVGGMLVLFRRKDPLLPVALYFFLSTAMSMLSGMMIFSWYIVPGIFAASIGVAVAAGAVAERSRTSRPGLTVSMVTALLLAFGGMQLTALHGQVQRSRETQGVETALRKKIGEWLRVNTPRRASILLEPIGYVGYYAGPEKRILDEIGLVTPRVVPLRSAGPGWYVPALQTLNPDYLVQYASALDRNQSEGTGDRLFAGGDQETWFQHHYTEIARFSVRGMFPMVDEKEKEYVVLRRTGY